MGKTISKMNANTQFLCWTEGFWCGTEGFLGLKRSGAFEWNRCVELRGTQWWLRVLEKPFSFNRRKKKSWQKNLIFIYPVILWTTKIGRMGNFRHYVIGWLLRGVMIIIMGSICVSVSWWDPRPKYFYNFRPTGISARTRRKIDTFPHFHIFLITF